MDKELQILIKRLKELGISTDEFVNRLNAAKGETSETVRITAEMARVIAEVEGTAGNLYDRLRSITSELKSSTATVKSASSAYYKLVDAASSLAADERGITDLNTYQLDQLIEKINRNKELLRIEAERLASGDGLSSAASEFITGLKRQVELQEMSADQAKDLLLSSNMFDDKQKTILASLLDNFDAAESLLESTKARREEERIISKNMGVTGALVQGTGALMERLGMRSGIFHDAMKDAADEMRHQSKLLGENASVMDRLNIAAKGFSILVKGFGAGLKDPAVAIGAIVQGFLDVNKAATETVQLTGQNAVFTQGLNTRLATTVQFLETTAELTKQTGMNAQNIFTPDVIAGAAELKNTMGLAANEAGGLAMIAQTTGGNIDATTNAIVDQTSAFNRANRSAVSQGQILRDVATASDGIKASFAGMPRQIAKAAAAARRLGMSISELDSIASSLLDFESSIEAELEAQLLTGRQLNLSKARELALNNDLAGVGREIFKNSADLVQFGKMNRIQQEAQAKALGLTRDQLGKIAYQRALEAGMTEEQAAKAAGVNAEEMKRIAIQEKIQMLLGKLAQAFTPILEALVPIVDTFTSIIAPIAGVVGYVAQLLGKFLQLKPVAFALKAAILGIAAAKLVSFTSGIASSIKSIGVLTAKINAFNAAKAAGASDKQILAGFYGTAAKEATQLTKTQIVLVKARNAVMSTGNKIRAIYNKLLDGSIWRAIKERTAIIGTYIADKIRIATQKIGNALRAVSNRLQNIAILGYIREKAAIIASTVAAKLNMAAQTAWNAVKNFQIGTMAKSAAFWIAEKARMIADTAQRWLNVGATAAQTAARATQAGVNATLAGSQAAVGTTGAAASGGLAAFGAALTSLTPALPVILGIGAALLLASPAIAAFGYAIKSAFEGVATIITAVGGVLSTILDKITLEKAAAMVVMGAGFASLAGGLAILTASIFTSIPAIGMLGAIALMGPGLMNAGTGIKAMAEGVARLSEALATLETEKLEEVKDLISTTAIAAPAVAATGAITSLIQGIAGTGGGNDNNMDAKLDELIAAVRSGANVRVYLDSDDITKRTVIESTTLS